MKNLVYVIDDDPDMREVITYALMSDGYQVIAYENGLDALKELETLSMENYPAMILVDFMMPVLDGISFVKKIKNDYADTIGKIPLVLSTAMGRKDWQPDLPPEVFQLTKPMDLDELLKVTKGFCNQTFI